MAFQNLSEQLFHALGRKIVQGKIKPGEHLPKVELLSEMNGVSRTVVREVLKGLAARRLIKSYTKIGTVVQPRSKWQWWDPDVLSWAAEAENNQTFLLQLTEVRLAIEPAAVELAANNATEKDIQEIKKRYEQLEQAFGDEPKWVEADYEFHSSILAASHNELMLSLLDTLRKALEKSRQTTIHVIHQHSPSAYEEVIVRHKKIMEAVCRGDGSTARIRMKELLERVSQLIVNASE